MYGLERNVLPKTVVAIVSWAIVVCSTLYLLPSQDSFVLILGLVGFPIAVVLTLMARPEYLWVIVVLSFLSLPYLNLRAEIGTLLVPIPAFLAVSVLVGLLLRQTFGGLARRIDRRLLVAWLFFLAANLVSVYHSVSLRSSVFLLLKWVFHGTLFFSLISTLRGEKHVRRLTFTFIIIITILSLTGLYRLFVVESAQDIDLFGGTATRDAPSYYLAITLPLGIALLWDPTLRLIQKGLVLLSVAVSGVALAFTFTRAGWISLLVALFILGLFQRKVWIFLAAALSVAVLAAPQAIPNRFSSIYIISEAPTSPYQSSSIARYYLLLTARNMIRDHPLIGVGVGTYTLNYHKYREAGAYVQPKLPHNEYLQTWAEAGIGALASLLWIAYMILSRLFRAQSWAVDIRERYLLLGYLGSAVSVFVYAIFSNNLNTMLTWLILALGVALANEVEEERRATLHGLQR